jgi:hypothetical protein
MRFTRLLAGAALVLAAVVLTTGALAGSNQGGAVVKLGQSSLGQILIDAHGKTLYLWAHDRGSNSWIVTVPGFFGKNVRATLTVYAVKGKAPAVLTGSEQNISNVVREAFTIAG